MRRSIRICFDLVKVQMVEQRARTVIGFLVIRRAVLCLVRRTVSDGQLDLVGIAARLLVE